MSLASRLALSTLLLGAAACGDNVPSAPVPPSDQTPESGDTPPAAKVDLGARLFVDTNLSEPGGEACSSCHDPARGFAGNAGSSIPGVAKGAAPGMFGNRNTPTAMYMMFSPPFSFVAEKDDEGGGVEYTPTGGQFWDGRADTLAEQAQGPFLNPREMGNPDAAHLIAKVRAADYAPMFDDIYGPGALSDPAAAFDHVADAISAFESTQRFRPFSSAFDDYLRGTAPLSPAAARGFALFKDPEKGNCIACHAGDPDSHDPADWLFTDFTYDNLGVPRNPEIPDNADPNHFDLGLCDAPGIAAKLPDGVTRESLCGAFKVPTLRDVALTAPYMHNGRFQTLRDVVSFYVTRDTNPERWYPTGHPFDDTPAAYLDNINHDEVPYDRTVGDAPRLTDAEIDDVVAFLESLTDR